MNKYSSRVTQPRSQGASQAMLYGIGLTDVDLQKPQVGICSMWYEGNTCNMHLDRLALHVKEGVQAAGLVGLRFNTVGVSDGLSMGTDGMSYSLPSRDLIADSIETVMGAQWYDALITVPGCDKNMPGSVIAMARLNRPSLMVYGGTIRAGFAQGKPRDIISAFQSYGEYLAGTITDDQRLDIVRHACPGAGACGGMYTANTMAVAIEALGLSDLHVVGQSLGGWIALEMAVRSTHRLRSLTLISAAGIHVKGVPKADIFMIDPEEHARLAYADPKKGAEAAERAGADKYQDLAILNRIASARFGWQPRFFNPRLERWLHRVKVPTQIIWGDGDRIIPPAYAEAFHRLIPGSTLTMIPNAGHLPHVERTPAVTQAMQSFLRN